MSAERLAAIAFVLDRVQQFPASSGTRSFAAELVRGLAEGRHVECARSGEYDGLRSRAQQLVKAYANVTPMVRRPKLKAVR